MGGIFLFKNFALVTLFVFCVSYNCYCQQKPLFLGINGTYTFYTNTSVSSSFISVDSAKAESVKKEIKNLCGESISFYLDKDIINNVLSNYKASFLFLEQGEDFYTCYYYSSKIAVYQLIKGVKVNIQVAYRQNTATIGSPIIYGSF